MPTAQEAIRLLQELGLTEYGSRCYVALARVEKATAKEISDLSEVPRSRVYDAVDRLHRRGLVDVQQSDPREYRSVPPDDALARLREEYTSTIESASDAFGQLKRSDGQEETGAWAIADHDHVTERIGSLLADAESEAYLLAVDGDLVGPDLLDDIEAAADRGVSVVAEVPSEQLRSAIEQRVPAATAAVTPLAESSSKVREKRLGRIVMVDRRSVLISSVAESALPRQSEETAVWAGGADHGLVVGLKHLLDARIDSGALEGGG